MGTNIIVFYQLISGRRNNCSRSSNCTRLILCHVYLILHRSHFTTLNFGQKILVDYFRSSRKSECGWRLSFTYIALSFYHSIMGNDGLVYRERIRKISPSSKDRKKLMEALCYGRARQIFQRVWQNITHPSMFLKILR